MAGSAAADGFQRGDDVAMAVPRLEPVGGRDGVALPQPLAPSEAARIRRILTLQRRGDTDQAAGQTKLLETDSALGQAMLGMVLADRYLGRFTRPDHTELNAWLARWSYLPDASAIHALLLSRLPRGAAPPPLPHQTILASPSPSATTLPRPPPPEETSVDDQALVRNPDLDRSVADAARNGGAATVRRLLLRTSGLTPAYGSQLDGEAARILFTQNRDAEAYDIAADGEHACGHWPAHGCKTAALAGYMAGLAAWRMERPDLARPMFEAAWRAELTTPSLRAAAAFWAARAHLVGHEPSSYRPWLQRAALERTTFYGLLARRITGLAAGSPPGERGRGLGEEREVLGEADVEAVAATREGLLAFALLQLGDSDRAAAELRLLWPKVVGTPVARAVMLVADRAGLSELAAQLADLLQAADGRPRDSLRFKIPRLQPDGGFSVDPAMVYGLARTESNFDAASASAAGALGIMQIMPDTAAFIIPRRPRGTPMRELLQDAGFNLALGQRYVTYLSTLESIDGDLIRLLAAYNCGPARLAQWSATLRHEGDPLLFIEAIPIDETRAFVPRVLAYTWLYARRLHLPTPSLDELAAGVWPRYHPLARQDESLAYLH